MIRMLKFVAMLAAGFIATACVPAVASESSSILFFNPLVRDSLALPKLQSLRFIAVDGFAPFSEFDSNGRLRGIHVDLARAICAELNISNSCTLQAIAYEDAGNLLISGQADVAFAGLVPNAQNRNDLNFSVPYFRFPSKFVTQKGVAIETLKSVGVVKDSVHEKMATLLFPKMKKTVFVNQSEAISALKSAAIPAWFGDGLDLAKLQNEMQFPNCCVLHHGNYYLLALRPDTLRAATSKKQTETLNAINAALRQMAVDGRLDEIFLRHMPVNPLK